MNGPGSPRSAEELERREAQLKLLIVSIQLAVVGWMLIPPHQRQLALMRAADLARRLAGACAARAGQAAMGAELATGTRAYEVPLLLSKARDLMSSAYEHARKAG